MRYATILTIIICFFFTGCIKIITREYEGYTYESKWRNSKEISTTAYDKDHKKLSVYYEKSSKFIKLDKNGDIDTLFKTIRYDTIRIPDTLDPSITLVWVSVSRSFKNYDDGKLISSGIIYPHWGINNIKYYQKTNTEAQLPNGVKLITKKLGPDTSCQIAYRANGTKLYEDNRKQYTYTIYDAKGYIDTLKYSLKWDTIQTPDLYNPDIIHDTIYYSPKFKHYSGKKLVSQGGLYNNKPFGDVEYYDKKKVVKTEKYDTQGKLLRISYHH